jgi:hypothetical protein
MGLPRVHHKPAICCIKTNLAHIEQLIELGATRESLNKKPYKTLIVVAEVDRQQQWLFGNKKQSIQDRIVSLSQPTSVPRWRGKAGKSVEFGVKQERELLNQNMYF